MYLLQSWGDTLHLIVELLATAAFALSGLMKAAGKKLDAVGICVVAFLAAFGGGTLRDLLLDQRPFFWVQHVEVLWGVMALCVLAMLFMRQRHFEVTEKAILWPDALGLGLFTSTGRRAQRGGTAAGVQHARQRAAGARLYRDAQQHDAHAGVQHHALRAVPLRHLGKAALGQLLDGARQLRAGREASAAGVIASMNTMDPAALPSGVMCW